ncbi:12951_t:CDS:2 [Ambispora gerdemannii]|uniref:12951_t:CDS:1 n=1 Tax=Ambispora gerdemannii TaxID=144530 RepID=A0A9N8VNL0_9GLOM|nr:12951_t:CDS:2 [Ambispora gerdemannii]
MTAVINFNIAVNGKNLLLSKEKTLSEQVIKEVEKEGSKKKEEIEKKKIREILVKKVDEKDKKQKEVKENIEKAIKGGGSLKKKEAKKIIEDASIVGREDVREKQDFEFEFNFFVKAFFSILHYYLMSYAYDSVERDLKKDLFRHFIRAKYANSSEVSRNLITQFADDLDEIAYILIIGEVLLFKRASKLHLAAKKRQEEDNKVIYERINNLEYIKVISGEKYEEEMIDRQLDSTFRQNKKSLWYSALFKAVPQYLIIPNIPIFFMALTLLFYSESSKMGTVFLIGNFVRYFFSVKSLNNEVNKIIEALLTLDELSGSLAIVNESAKTLNYQTARAIATSPVANLPFQNGDIIFQKVVFAYPKRPQQDILRNFSFTFQQGKSYGIAGKNGIGKSTITKTTLKLYDLKAGQIFIGEHNIQEIDTISLHRHICYQTNRPTFFHLSIAENVYYPNEYQKKDHNKLIQTAKKTGIYEFITKLPQGFDTVLREGGSDLSEGQKQQISAMKIFINDYDIYILDEILSNVHPDLKGIILGNIFAKLKGKTVLVIDHHYEIFQYVDYVYQFTENQKIILASQIKEDLQKDLAKAKKEEKSKNRFGGCSWLKTLGEDCGSYRGNEWRLNYYGSDVDKYKEKQHPGAREGIYVFPEELEPNDWKEIEKVNLNEKITIAEGVDNKENTEKDKPVENKPTDNSPNSPPKELNNKTLLQYFQKKNIKSIKLEGEILIIEHNDN